MSTLLAAADEVDKKLKQQKMQVESKLAAVLLNTDREREKKTKSIKLMKGIYGPDEGWASAYPECRERNQSPINIVDQDTKVSTEYQELTLEGFDTESSNKTSMKNTGKTGKHNLAHYYHLLVWSGNATKMTSHA
ncbi:Receptor-type tyrosine-protein phosphatase gamma [Collichthys lucidus]|uniref:Receptor-type tyrosine-protein phosphatase gamma n=1 Tax=Collichthys lucidus TaxID=240159 RepID=A0A4U5U8B4_COLLU|nr:Receptor-type tyrosine-protein phosphatase gamma [Collichthys lucidus]